MTYKITEELFYGLDDLAKRIKSIVSRIEFETAVNEHKEKVESKPQKIPKGYVTIADFCNKSKLIGITSMRRMIGELEISTASKNIKPLYFDPLEFIGLLEDGRLSDYTVIQNRYNALKDISPFLIELRKQINQIN